MLTKEEVIVKRIREGIMPEYAKSLYSQSLLALGIERQSSFRNEIDQLPYFPATYIEALEVGRSRRMLSSIHIMVSRLLSNIPAVEVRHVDDVEAEVMRQFLSNRIHGTAGDQGWIEEIKNAGRDGNALGLGAVQVGVEDGDDGFQKVTVKYVQPWYVLFDAYEQNLTQSNWVCFVHHLPIEDAQEYFPDDAEQFAFSIGGHDNSSISTQVVRIYEYYDMGARNSARGKKSKPTRCLILGHLNSKKVIREENVFGILPVAVCTGYTNPTQIRPYGRIMNEANIEAMINLREEKMKESMERRGGLIFDTSSLDETDLKAYLEGRTNFIMAKGVMEKSPVFQIPEDRMDSADFQFLDYYLRTYNVQSNLSELDRGVPVSKRQTAQEIQALVTQSAANRSIEAQQQALFLKRLIEKVFIVAKNFDNAPMVIELYASEIEINRPEEPNSSISKFLEGNYEVFVDAESLTAGEKVYEDAAELAKIRELAPMVGQTISPEEYTKQVLKLVGVEDPTKWLMLNQALPMPQEAQGQGSMQPGGTQRPEDIANAMLRGNPQAA